MLPMMPNAGGPPGLPGAGGPPPGPEPITVEVNSCDATECKFNKENKCTAPDGITVTGAHECGTYEKAEGAPEGVGRPMRLRGGTPPPPPAFGARRLPGM